MKMKVIVQINDMELLYHPDKKTMEIARYDPNRTSCWGICRWKVPEKSTVEVGEITLEARAVWNDWGVIGHLLRIGMYITEDMRGNHEGCACGS